MPGFDKTGPQGKGQMTGRGLGPCGGGRGIGIGLGRCRGFGRGLGRNFNVKDLQAYKKALQEEMEDLEKQLADLPK
jgi:hypothetical protein